MHKIGICVWQMDNFTKRVQNKVKHIRKMFIRLRNTTLSTAAKLWSILKAQMLCYLGFLQTHILNRMKFRYASMMPRRKTSLKLSSSPT